MKTSDQLLNEFIEHYVNRIDRSEDGLVEECLKDGAQWQAERMYSEEDMKQFAFECVAIFLSNNDNKIKIKLVDGIANEINNKFEQFKK